MISKQTLYLSEDRSEVVVEGDKKAKFLLVKEGHEIPDALVEKHDAAKFVQSEPKSPKAEPEQKGPAPQNKEQAMPKLRKRQK